MRDWRGFSGFSCTCTPPGYRRVCVCISSCQDPVTSAAACCDWDMVPSRSPGWDLRTPALYRYRCRFIHTPLFSSDFIPVVPLKEERNRENLRSETVLNPREKRRRDQSRAVRCDKTRYALHDLLTLWLLHVWAISFLPQEKISRKVCWPYWR